MATEPEPELDLPDPVPERVLTVTAHPDDVDFGTAGTVARLTEAGAEVSYCVVTDGDAGMAPDGMDRHEVGPMRHDEQRAAAAEVGVADVRFLGFPDGAVEATMELRTEISRMIRIVRPQLVISQSPERRYDRIYASHPDHLAAGEATIAAVYPDARNPYAHPQLLAEGLEPWSVPLLWVMGGPDPDRFVDITDVFDRKHAALRAHKSQTGEMDDLEGMLRDWGHHMAQVGGLPEGRQAEAFREVVTV